VPRGLAPSAHRARPVTAFATARYLFNRVVGPHR
jgi:hypothetical protein